MSNSPIPNPFTAPTFKTRSVSPHPRSVITTSHPSSSRPNPKTNGHASTTHSHPHSRPGIPLSSVLDSNGQRRSTTSPDDQRPEDEVDELREEDEKIAIARRLATTGCNPTLAGAKSRKSSCDLCHHRKIKCDQVRPSCSSCTRKGHQCRYSEETEPNNPYNPANRVHVRANSVTVVSASNSGDKWTVEVPRVASVQSVSAPVSSGQNNLLSPSRKHSPGPMYGGKALPQKGANGFEGGPVGSDKGSASGNGEVSKKKSTRDRIVNGFDSDSEDGEGSIGKDFVKAERRIDIADLMEGNASKTLTSTTKLSENEEVDELESGDEKASGSVTSSGKKRDVSLDDELSGELLELASAPPKKKKPKHQKPEVTVTAVQPQASRPVVKNYQRFQIGPRNSLPSSLPQTLPPTPSTSVTHSQSNRFDPYSTPLQTLMASLPSVDTQSILFNTFFADPFLTEGISLLQPQYLEDFRGLFERRSSRLREGDATTLANSFAFLAIALRILPEETSKLLLASANVASVASSGWSGTSLPRSLPRIISSLPASVTDPTPLDQRYLDLAILASQIAEQSDTPSVMLVMLKLVLYRYSVLGPKRDRIVLAGGFLAQAIKVAQALGMGKEWEGIPQGERELRRRVMWSLYVADRQHSFETSFPYTILDAHQGIHLPSPISETDLYQIRPETPSLPPHSTEVGPTACTALFIHTHLARRVTPILDSLATVSAAGTPHDLVLRFDASLDAFQDALPPYLRLYPSTDTQWDSVHPYLPPHRVRLHSTLLSYRMGVHRTHLPTYLNPTTPSPMRQVLVQVCLSTLRVQRSSKMLDPKVAARLFNPSTVFEAAATLALVLYVEKALVGMKPAEGVAATKPSIVQSSAEFMGLRAGVAEAGELLDNVGGTSEGAGFARKAVGILREIMVKVDSPVVPRPALETTNGNPEPGSGIEKAALPLKDSADVKASGLPPSIAGITHWLENWRAQSISVEFLMKEAEWNGAWEKVVAGM